ncbi:dTDP-4-dehydrorhamnose reductase [Niallia nealsonii]|uniref:dTDP-4-dehydrorhamnose reductase n=1 Tax=Niallia nealsonii TaxID=115979 RepID=A0A2N0Z3X8_9BACI|nr:dTDP-4-dehydrorhamnose reductase [Niallia nealsonii]PKG24189.1 dTDP-4-dehydrorhamnose reductase [Niallia nealsonii]
MKIFITGANGQLGQDVVALAKKNKTYQVHSFTKNELDITDEQAVHSKVKEIQPDWILHCAAYTNVEAAEDDGKELNWKINKDGSAIISKAAASVQAKLIYISTDYVFDGTKKEWYKTTDTTNPLNEYGKAKLAGEQEIQKYLPDAHIIRTSWVFGEHGHNFVYTMLNLAKKMDTLKVVNDQFGRPTYAKDLAAFMLYTVEKNIEGGLYHFSNDETATWFDFAKEIVKAEAVEVVPVDSSAFPQKAKRPQYSVMSLEKVKATGFSIPTWKNALERFMKNK